VLAEAAHKTGRAKADFELREISREEYERLKSLILDPVIRVASKATVAAFGSLRWVKHGEGVTEARNLLP
jgi:hypothetical protein